MHACVATKSVRAHKRENYLYRRVTWLPETAAISSVLICRIRTSGGRVCNLQQWHQRSLNIANLVS